MTKSRYYHVSDDEWVTVPKSGFKDQCCDCASVHVVKIRVVNGQIQFKAKRDARATAAARKHFKFEKDE